MSDTFQPGEIVDITIRGARVLKLTNPTGRILSVEYQDPNPPEDGTCRASLIMDSPAITVERVAPAEWPPQIGDLWRDSYGNLWFISRDPTSMSGRLLGRTAGGTRWTDDMQQLIDDHAPLTIVHREPATDGGAR